MTDTANALRLNLDGTLTTIDIGTTRREQTRRIGRALLGSAEAVDYIDRPGTTAVVALAPLIRNHQPVNSHAAHAIHTIAQTLPHTFHGPVLLIGYTDDGHMVSLPDDIAAQLRNLVTCPHASPTR
ncbi:hypothetical protein [Streptomyces bacillaris]|uniref:hypothetical protein n=1 Tax=Streptomyces bacillaris TaxID=68179 RepID=UPI003D730274